MMDATRIKSVSFRLKEAIEALRGEKPGNEDSVRELVGVTRDYEKAITKMREDLGTRLKTTVESIDLELRALGKSTRETNWNQQRGT